MNNKTYLSSLVLVITFLISSCSDAYKPEDKGGALGKVQPGGEVLTLDEQFSQVTRELPGFGGVFYDKVGDLNVYMTQGALEAQAIETQQEDVAKALVSVFGVDILSRGKASRAGVVGVQALPKAEVKILEGRFDFLELAAWYAKANSVLSLPGVVLTDIDEARNRLTIGVEDATVRRSVEKELSKRGIPRSAVAVEVTEPFRPLLTLQDRNRSAKGGTQIQNSSNWGICTLGFNVFRGAERGFITNSHCTRTQGGTEGTVFYQANTNPSDRVGVERRDPAYFTGGACPTGYRCRYSDTTFVRYDAAVSGYMKAIARVTGSGRTGSATAGSLTIDLNLHRYVIAKEVSNPIWGQRLDKIGRTTGHTYGTVNSTCINTRVAHTDIVLLCQSSVGNAYSNGGDSGSPVFSWRSSGQVDLYGILWGSGSGSFVFSPMSNIERASEMGPLTTF